MSKVLWKKDGNGTQVQVNSRKDNASSKIFRAGTKQRKWEIENAIEVKANIEKVFMLYLFFGSSIRKLPVTLRSGVEIIRKAR